MLYQDNLSKGCIPSACGGASFPKCSKLFSTGCRNSVLSVFGSPDRIQNSLAVGLLLQDLYPFLLIISWAVLPWKQACLATGSTSEPVLRWPPWRTVCEVYRLIFKVLQCLVHSDSASASGSSGLCRCLVWDNVCANVYCGLLISVTADAYRFDLRKLIKSLALPTCLVAQYSVSLQLRIGVSSDLSYAELTAVTEWWVLSLLLLDIGGQGGVPVPVKMKNCGFGAEVRQFSPGTLTPVMTWLVAHENKTSVLTVICLGLGSSRSIARSSLDVDNRFCVSGDFPGDLF